MTAKKWIEPRAFQEEEILRWKDVHRIVKLSANTVRKMEREGRFPKRFPLTDYSVGWLKSDVLNWMRSLRSADRPAASRTA